MHSCIIYTVFSNVALKSANNAVVQSASSVGRDFNVWFTTSKIVEATFISYTLHQTFKLPDPTIAIKVKQIHNKRPV